MRTFFVSVGLKTCRLNHITFTRKVKFEQEVILISSVLFTIFHVICAMQIMSGTQPNTFINAIAEHKNSAIGRHFLETHGNNNLLKGNQFTVFRKCQRKFDCLAFELIV